MKQIALVDFRGGYATDIAPELMTNNELLIAQNCYWDSGLKKRKGTYSWDQIWGTATSIVGGIRSYIAKDFTGSGYYNVLAMDNGTSVTFYHSQSSVTATLLAGYSFTTGCNVEFDAMDGLVLAVNGVNKPAIMYCTSTWEIMNLETYDTRERGTATWWAGRREGEGSASSYVDDTNDAQSSATGDFEICRTTAYDGHYISCNYTFNKIYYYNVSTASGITWVHWYYKGNGSWANPSIISSITVSGSPPSATQVLEFTWPSDWALGDSFAAFVDNDDLKNKYILLVTFSDSSCTTYCGNIEVQNSQYLTQVMDDDRPQAIAIHNRRVHLAAGNNVYVSQYGSPGGYELKYTEYFLEGGREIQQMVPFQDYLVVLKENAFYGFYGNSIDTWVKKRLHYGSGAISRRGAAAVKNDLFYVGRDGIHKWDGVQDYLISKHIHTDFDSWYPTTAVGFDYRGEYWVSFPSSTITLRCDPDTFRTDEMGDGRVGWFKIPLGFTQFLYNRDGGDSGNFFGVVKCTATGVGGPHLCQLEYADNGKDVWCGSTTAIEMVMQTGYKTWDGYGKQTRYTRVLPRISQVTASSGATCTHCLISNNSSVTVSITQVLSTAGWNMEYYSIPYTLDGKNLSYYFKHAGSQTVALAGVTFEAEGRYF